MRREPEPWELARIRAILEYQFDAEVASALLEGRILVETGGKGSVRYVIVDGVRMLTLRPNDGLFSISVPAARRIVASSKPPRYRVIVRGEREIRGSVLVADVIEMDPELRPGDEAVVVDRDDKIIAVGRVKLPRAILDGLARGEVVRVRRRVKE
ncbi:MAG: hypothetical protein F7C34_04275 [Desulfurococcales archaeon]|nr:hypothetical protein [Desulfurococcales archaeon]